MRRSLRVQLVAATVLAAVATPAAATAAPNAPKPQAREQTITLLTGDRVTLSANADVRQVEPSFRRTGMTFRVSTSKGHRYVVPRDAEDGLRTGRIDRRLFDVTTLAANGLDDRHATVIPLLFTGPAGVTRSAAAPVAPRGVKVARSLPSLGITAATSPKTGTGWSAIKASGGKVWLNARRRVSLDHSVPQIGAPAAWQAGYTGKGVTAAVLDTGYDAGHPDLKGVVTESKDFTASPEGVKDIVGHGTHVAATVAGRGTASAGKYTGVAKEASLIIGKVCLPEGCADDAILAGMEWAARSGAKAVNMSLGDDGSDGTDPMSQAVNTLTAQYGTLFVAAAGNSGERGHVGSPAAADSALAVGSVGREDAASDFSSAGPRIGDYALKPDIAAPGENIVAARAEGTLDEYAVDALHARLSGTSMATPHVTGSVLILAQQHPDWSPAQLKAHLMTTSHPAADVDTPWRVGTGRVDLARATSQPVTADVGSLSFGLALWPHSPAQKTAKTVTYRNDGDADVALSVSGADAGVWSADATAVTVPAHGSASVAVTFDPTKAVGLFGGWLTASTADGRTALRTSIAGMSEAEHFTVDTTVTGRDGKPAAGEWVTAVPLTGDAEPGFAVAGPDGKASLRVERGDYGLYTSVTVLPVGVTGKDFDRAVSVTDLVVPSLAVGTDTHVDLDARKAKPVTVGIAGDPASSVLGRVSTVSFRPGDLHMSYPGYRQTQWYSWSAPGQNPELRYRTGAILERPVIELSVTAPQRFAVPVGYAGSSKGKLLGAHNVRIVDGGSGSPADLEGKDLKGALVLLRDIDTLGGATARLAAGGALAALQVGPLSWFEEKQYPLPVLSASTVDAARLVMLASAGAVSATTQGITASPVSYTLAFGETGSVPTGKRYRPSRADLAAVSVSYAQQGAEDVARTDNLPLIGTGFGLPALPHRYLPMGGRRTEFFSADPVSWRRTFMVGSFVGASDVNPVAGQWSEIRPAKLRAGSRSSLAWGSTPMGPSLRGSSEANQLGWGSVERTGNVLHAEIPVYSPGTPAGGVPVVASGGPLLEGSLALSKDGAEIGHTADPVTGDWTLPSGAGDYTLDLTAKRTAPQLALNTGVRTRWTFRSEEGQPLPPLLTLDSRLPGLDLRNSAAATGTTPLSIQVVRQDSAAADVASVRVWVSAGDAGQWTEVRAVRAGDRWAAALPGGTAGQFVSLRVAATDRGGSAVDQTVTRAYRLR